MIDNFRLVGAGQAVNTGSLYRLPFGQIFVRGISTSGLGALQGMLDEFLEYGRTRVSRAGGRSAENPMVQLLCAETAGAIDEMKTTLHRTFEILHGYAQRGETPPLEERLKFKFQSTAVTERCTSATPRASSRRPARPACSTISRSAASWRTSRLAGSTSPTSSNTSAATGAG